MNVVNNQTGLYFVANRMCLFVKVLEGKDIRFTIKD